MALQPLWKFTNQTLSQLFIRDINQFLPMELRYHELHGSQIQSEPHLYQIWKYHKISRLTACPWLKGWISRNAKTFSDSKSLKLGISPIRLDKQRLFQALGGGACGRRQTFYNFAENTRCHFAGHQSWLLWSDEESEGTAAIRVGVR